MKLTDEQRAAYEAACNDFTDAGEDCDQFGKYIFAAGIAHAQERAATVERCAAIAESCSPRHTECGNKIAAAIRQGGGNV